MINLKSLKNKRILFISTILIFIVINIFLMNLDVNQNLKASNQYEKNNVDYLIEDLKNQDLSSDNTYSGIGAPWNVTHWANRTDYDLDVSFINNSYDVVDIPLGNGWNGYKLNATIENLYDTRNWVNGSFNYGNDNGYQTDGNDTSFISNNFQNWTFGEYDDYDDNDFSGNYVDSTDSLTDFQDSLELRMNGFDEPGPDIWGYDSQDRVYWTSFINVPRGQVVDSELKFDIRDTNLMPSNVFELRVLINDEQIYSIGALNLRQACSDSWRTFSIPQGLWTNSSSIYTNPVIDSVISLNFTLIFTQPSGYYTFNGFENGEYQQLFIDNVELIITAETKPSQIQLKMNDLAVNDIYWGKGATEQANVWTVSPIQANFTSDDTWELGGYIIDLKTDLILYASKDTPETNWETDVGSLGSDFSVSNSSIVNWESYSYFAVPNGYEESEMKLEFPTDVNITFVSEPQDPSTNILSECDNSTQGFLIIPVNTISATPDGFCKFKAASPNYCAQVNIYNNASGIWSIDNQFLSGDYINITAKITDSPLITSYIQQTKAQLQIRFPNGTIWTNQNQLKSPDANGFIYFDYFMIPNLPPNYEVGEYEVILTWNNTYNNYGANETGIISSKFNVIHQSVLTPDQNYFEEIIEDEKINLKVSFNDLENFNAIQSALVYIDNFIGGREYFSEISPGYYFLEFNTTKGVAGNNTLTIYANSSLYLNNQINVTIEVLHQTVLITQEYPTLEIVWGENFTIHLNYTVKSSSAGLSTTPTNNWIGDSYVTTGSPGEYIITCNSAAYEVDKIHLLIIDMDKEGYESQSVTLGISIIKRESNFAVYIDSFEISELYQVEKSFNEIVSISLRLYDITAENFLSNEAISINGENYADNLVYTTDFWYNISLTCAPSNFSLGLNSIDIRFIKGNYEINTFSFHFSISNRESNFSVYIDSFEIPELYQVEKSFNEIASISLRIYDIIAENFLSNEVIAINGENYAAILTYSSDFWYNISLTCSPLNFSLGLNSFDIRFIKENYEINIFSFQLLISQIEIGIESIGFEDTINAEIGDTITIQMQLSDPNTLAIIENASITYSWEYGIGTMNQTSPGTYQEIIDLPQEIQGNYKFEMIITPESSIYKPSQYSFIVVIGEPVIGGNQLPSPLLWGIILILIGIVSALGILSLRSYVLVPRKRRKESELLSKTQRFKDLNNIQAVVVVHTLSGIPIYTKSYSILEKRKKELFSGFIQAITMVGEEFSDDSTQKSEDQDDAKSFGGEKMIELDFKQFYCLIADREEVRVIFILKEKASERLKSQVSHLMLALNLKLANELGEWDGSLDIFEKMIPSIILEYFELYYKESFKIAENINFLKLRKEQSLSKMEMRVINVIQSMSKDEIIADLNHIIEMVSEENKDLIIEAIELLIRRKLILPTSLKTNDIVTP